jgi:protein TonB
MKLMSASHEASSVQELFAGSLVGRVRSDRSALGMPISVAAHVIVGAALILVPILWPSELPPTAGVQVSLLNMAPPPPPPLALGRETAKPKERDVTPEEPKKIETPKDDRLVTPRDPEIQPEQKPSVADQQGSADGVLGGDPLGMKEGVEGGVVGGVPGGQLGGCIGCTGDVVVDVDQQPRILRQPRPQYPTDNEAFLRTTRGIVVVKIVIDEHGKVILASVLESVPLLDQAALKNVYQWVFTPAMKNGRPVKTEAIAEVKFNVL